jgi:hypothetical protein
MSISGSSQRCFGVNLLEGHPERFVVHAPDGQEVCRFTMTLVEHPQVVGGWLLRVDSHPGDAGRVVPSVENKNLYWADGGER